jgi:hypothetical protein
MNHLWSWAVTNQEIVFFLVLGIVVNLAPRPHPDNVTGWQKAFWTVTDRLCVLTAERVPGKVKWLLLPSPSAEKTVAAPVVTEKDEEKTS